MKTPKSRVGLINWSGHGNLGDDAMADILYDVIPGAVHMGEHCGAADWYILGGGTLIAPQSLFMGIIIPEKTIGMSLGVADSWNGECVDELKRMKKIYVRDIYSYQKLQKFDINCTLSADLLCYLSPTKDSVRNKTYANLMMTQCSTLPSLQTDINQYKRTLMSDVKFFGMSPIEDKETVPHAEIYKDAQKLIDDLMSAERVVATRLHGNVAAWIAEVPDIEPIIYCKKVDHFYQRVDGHTPEDMRKIVKRHLREICELVSV